MTRTARTAKTTKSLQQAQERFDSQLEQLEHNIELLKEKFYQFGEMENIDWGHVGDIAHINSVIEQITNPEE